MPHIINMIKPNGFSFMRIFLTILFSVLLLCKGHAQNNNSPYSLLGIGDLEDGFANRTSGLSSTGIAYRSSRNLITNNPASLSALENQWFAGEIGIKGKFVSYSGNPVSTTNSTSTDITFKRFTLGTKLFKHWGSAIGIAPYSTENYEYTGTKPLGVGGNLIPSYNEGYGGINKVFWANGYEFFNHLSIGITSSYLFGAISTKNVIQGPSGSAIYLSKNDKTFYNNFYFDYGIQYYTALNKHWDISLGLVYANEGWLNTDHQITILDIDSIAIRSKRDVGTFTIPASYGAGLTITRNKKYTFLADYRFQDWGSLRSNTNDFLYEKSQRASVGFEISNQTTAYNTRFETSFIQAGLYYNKSYIVVNGKPIEDMGITAGFGINAKRTPLNLNVSLQYGIRGTTENNLIKENYFGATFIFSYRDFWFTKGRKFE
jgi:hypothetical protein